MKTHITYIAIITLLLTVYFLDQKNERLEKELLNTQVNELKSQRDSIIQQLGRTIVERDHLNHRFDSLLHLAETLELDLDKANKKLKLIPHRYDNVPNDSLGRMMDERAKTRRK